MTTPPWAPVSQDVLEQAARRGDLAGSVLVENIASELLAARALLVALVEAEGRRDYAMEIYREYRDVDGGRYDEYRQQYNDACAALCQAQAAIRAHVARLKDAERTS